MMSSKISRRHKYLNPQELLNDEQYNISDGIYCRNCSMMSSVIFHAVFNAAIAQ
jgi:hypothetical protein